MATSRHRVLIWCCNSFTSASVLNALDSTRDFEVIGCVRTWDELVDLSYRLVPGILIFDTDCSEGQFAQILTDFKCEFPKITVLAISMMQDEARAMEAIKAGANGFCLKSKIAHRLSEAVMAVARGNAWMDSSIAGGQSAPKALAKESRGGFNGSKLAHMELTAREQQILQYIMTGLSKTQVAELLNISLDEVLSKEKRLKQKLAVPEGLSMRRPDAERK